MSSSCFDPCSTRPFLTAIEKKWIAFQILTGLRDARKRKISHGDIKSENILVTSWNWVYITDFSSFKPTFLPLDNPSDFGIFYDTSGRRNCYIAPERFFVAEKPADSKHLGVSEDMATNKSPGSRRDGKVAEAMDVFSTGCVLAELFLEGTALFTLSQLFKYRAGELDIDGCLADIEEESVKVSFIQCMAVTFSTCLEIYRQSLIKQMVALDPSLRPTFDALLHTYRGSLFPEFFYSPLHDLMLSVNDLSGSSPFLSAVGTSPVNGLVLPSSQRKPGAPDDRSSSSERHFADIPKLPTDSDRRIFRIWNEFDTVEPWVKVTQENFEAGSIKIDYLSTYSFKPVQVGGLETWHSVQ